MTSRRAQWSTSVTSGVKKTCATSARQAGTTSTHCLVLSNRYTALDTRCPDQYPARYQSPRGLFPAQASPDLPHRLFQPMLVLDEGQAQESFPRLAESPSRADGDFGFFEQLHGKIDRPQAL